MQAFAITLLMIAALMIVSAIVGGNTEYNGLKIPSVGVISRAALFATGGGALVLALGVAAIAEYGEAVPSSPGARGELDSDTGDVGSEDDPVTTDPVNVTDLVNADPDADPVDVTDAGNVVLDDLHSACAETASTACDDLYAESPAGSDYESFGATCGGLVDPTNGGCEALSALVVSCGDGDYDACSELYWASDYGSELEHFGETCGKREPEGTCH